MRSSASSSTLVRGVLSSPPTSAMVAAPAPYAVSTTTTAAAILNGRAGSTMPRIGARRKWSDPQVTLERDHRRHPGEDDAEQQDVRNGAEHGPPPDVVHGGAEHAVHALVDDDALEHGDATDGYHRADQTGHRALEHEGRTDVEVRGADKPHDARLPAPAEGR